MRRSTTLLLAAALFVTACSDDPDIETGSDMADLIESATTTPTTTSATPSSTLTPTTTLPAGSSTTTLPPTTTTAPEDAAGMCGDWIPVVTDFGTTCVDPETLPPEAVAPSTPWTLPSVDPGVVEERWFVPPLALLNQDSVTLLETVEEFGPTRITPWARLDAWADDLRVASDGALVAQHVDPDGPHPFSRMVVVYDADGTTTTVPDAAMLFDVGEVNGAEAVVVSGPGDDQALIEARPLLDPSVVLGEFGLAAGGEFGATHVDVADGLAVVTAWADLSEVVGFVELGGESVDRPSPTDDLGYNQPPFVTAATLSPDGRRVTWAEGPDWDGAAEEMAAGRWMVWSMDLASGDIVLGWPVSEEIVDSGQLLVWSIHDLGDQIVVNFMTWRQEEWWPTQATVIDLAYEEPDSYRLPITGIAVPVPYELG